MEYTVGISVRLWTVGHSPDCSSKKLAHTNILDTIKTSVAKIGIIIIMIRHHFHNDSMTVMVYSTVSSYRCQDVANSTQLQGKPDTQTNDKYVP